MIVAIDGPAGSGKSSVSKEVARRRGLTFLDTGAMYRCVTLACLDRGVDPRDEDAVARLAHGIAIAFGTAADGSQTVRLDGADVTADIRTARVDQNVSAVAAQPRVRERMVALQREMGAKGDVIAEGRDVGTVVFPHADVKVFLTADAAARAHRRAVQRGGGDTAKADASVSVAEERQILDDLRRRDELDSTRTESPLKAADDAHVLDSSGLSFDEVVETVIGYMG